MKVCAIKSLKSDNKSASYYNQPLNITANSKTVDLERFLTAVNEKANNYLLVFQEKSDCKKLTAVPDTAKKLFGNNLPFQI